MATSLLKSVAVIVLSWNKQHEVISCIDRVIRLTGADIQVIVVDNASIDDSVAAIRKAHPGITILEQTRNRGFTGGVNRGLAEAARRGVDYAWILNDDTRFEPTVLVDLLAFAAANPSCGLLSPSIDHLPPQQGEQFHNGLIDWERGILLHNVTPATYRARIAEGATPVVTGTALLCDLRVPAAIGPIDERFFAYWEDTDFAVRAMQSGFASAVVPSATVLHATTATRHQRPPHYHYYMIRNEALFWRLHFAGRPVLRWKRRWLAASLEWLAQNRDLGHVENATACIDAIWHAATRRYGDRQDHAPAPRWVHRLLMARPYLFFSMVNGDVTTIMRRLLRI